MQGMRRIGDMARANVYGAIFATFAATSAETSELYDWVGFKPNTPVKVGVAKFVAWYRDFYNVH